MIMKMKSEKLTTSINYLFSLVEVLVVDNTFWFVVVVVVVVVVGGGGFREDNCVSAGSGCDAFFVVVSCRRRLRRPAR